ncbi:hypothetical protein [Anaerosacchariphilus polymeriproducens]|uniref:ABC transporter permease n=1 Tax=Anaerosacchariphilus polymeriproducens TaxID=1812858 RepID=A0A371AQH8_9FIRM|nr:hypothetical protein [Anaerosacchariphilus polymeriproducens]RDU21839.1 hypothetical protein DWV06_17810 [Anaerosacchariphilus polymeriproducens]
MLIKELILFYKRNLNICLFVYIQITIFMVLIGTFYSFIYDLDFENSDMKKMYEDNAIYQMIDNYVDGNEFNKFVVQKDSLSKLKNFYNGLENAESFHYITIANQHLLITDQSIPDKFAYGYANGMEVPSVNVDNKVYKPIKSLQINLNGAKFFNLKAAEGKVWNEEDFVIQNTMPIILGDSYHDIYKVGDKLHIKYLEKDINCIVIGFLEKNSKIFYQNNLEFYLDDYILMPMWNYIMQPQSEFEARYQMMNYFNMINGYLVTKNNKNDINRMMQELESISKDASFDGYTFIGYNPHVKKYQDISVILQENKNLIKIILTMSCILNIILILFISYLQYKNERYYYNVFLIQGAKKSFIITLKFLEIMLIVLAAFLTQLYILNHLLKIGEFATYIKAGYIGVFVILSYVIFGTNLLLNNKELKIDKEEEV